MISSHPYPLVVIESFLYYPEHVWIRKRERLRIEIRVALNLCTEMVPQIFNLDLRAVITLNL